MPNYNSMLEALRWMASFSDESLKTATTLHYDLVGKAREVLSQPSPGHSHMHELPDATREIGRLTARIETMERERREIANAMEDIKQAQR